MGKGGGGNGKKTNTRSPVCTWVRQTSVSLGVHTNWSLAVTRPPVNRASIVLSTSRLLTSMVVSEKYKVPSLTCLHTTYMHELGHSKNDGRGKIHKQQGLGAIREDQIPRPRPRSQILILMIKIRMTNGVASPKFPLKAGGIPL